LSSIYGSRSANVKKGEWYKTFDIAAGTYSSFTETDKDFHTIKRRWVSPSFSTESLSANESRMVDVIERFCNTLKPSTAGWGLKWNASEMCTYLGFDIMGALVFGCDFKTVEEEENRDLANSVLPASMLMYWVRPAVFDGLDNVADTCRSHICLWPFWFAHCSVPASSK
jgi:cytochrome P450